MPMRVLFALPGFHRHERGAEIALLAVARELAECGEAVTVAGSGPVRANVTYRYWRVPSIPRERFERFPSLPAFRNETAWEDATFAASLWARLRVSQYDAMITCSFPFTHWALRKPGHGTRPKQIFVTQNGDWPAVSRDAEFRLFRCDGLVCTNPDYAARNAARWNVATIPNGVTDAFRPGRPVRTRFGLPEHAQVVLMVSALIESKRVEEGIRAVARLPGAHLVVAGDGPLRDTVLRAAARDLPDRFTNLVVGASDMPDLYRSADAFLHMSLLESFGNVFVEAMACGLPIVGHDSERLRWIVGDIATLCDTRDEQALVASLHSALGGAEAPCAARVARFRWPVIGAHYRAFLRATVSGTGPDARASADG